MYNFPYTQKKLCGHILWFTNWFTFCAYLQWMQKTWSIYRAYIDMQLDALAKYQAPPTRSKASKIQVQESDFHTS